MRVSLSIPKHLYAHESFEASLTAFPANNVRQRSTSVVDDCLLKYRLYSSSSDISITPQDVMRFNPLRTPIARWTVEPSTLKPSIIRIDITSPGDITLGSITHRAVVKPSQLEARSEALMTQYLDSVDVNLKSPVPLRKKDKKSLTFTLRTPGIHLPSPRLDPAATIGICMHAYGAASSQSDRCFKRRSPLETSTLVEYPLELEVQRKGEVTLTYDLQLEYQLDGVTHTVTRSTNSPVGRATESFSQSAQSTLDTSVARITAVAVGIGAIIGIGVAMRQLLNREPDKGASASSKRRPGMSSRRIRRR